MVKIGVLGGSGIYDMAGLSITDHKKIATPFGDPSDTYRLGELSGVKVIFLPRHGTPHHIPPHQINYRANIWGFKELGVERIISVNAVGGISSDMKPGTIVIPDQIIDMTKKRKSTFYDSDNVVHIDFTEPYCNKLRTSLLKAGKKSGTALIESGTYLCVDGPRLETKAEIAFFKSIGADVVGMTVMPEASLAREGELCFACVAVVTNYAAGIKKKRLTTTEVVETMKRVTGQISGLLRETIQLISDKRVCACKDALKEARM